MLSNDERGTVLDGLTKIEDTTLKLAQSLDKLAEMASYYRNTLVQLKAMIEQSQTNEIRSHFTVNRPMAEVATYYGVICEALSKRFEPKE